MHSGRLSDCLNGTREEKKSSLDGDYNRVVYILVLTISNLVLLVTLIVFGPYRRQSSNILLKGALWASYVLPFSIVVHTLGLMQSPPYNNETYAIWAVLFLLVHGISNSTLYGIQDSQQGKRAVLQEVVLLYLAGWLFYLHHNEPKLDWPLVLILLFTIVKFLFGLIQKCFTYSRKCSHFGLRRRTKLVADFMSYEQDLSSKTNPVNMAGYKYLVKGEEKVQAVVSGPLYLLSAEQVEREVVTVEKIWQCQGKLLSSSAGGGDPKAHLKDRCLSFAFFRLLMRRFRGYPLHESHHRKTWNLVSQGLLSKKDNHERAFRVIEVELSFLFDYFYSKYPLIFSDGKFFVARTTTYAILEIFQFIAGIWIIVSLFRCREHHLINFDLHRYQLCSEECDSGLGNLDSDFTEYWDYFRSELCPNRHLPNGIHFFGTCIFVFVFVLLQILQLLNIVCSDWTKVWLLCEYVQRPSLQRNCLLERAIGFVCGRKFMRLKPWKKKMDQYFLLSSFNYLPIPYFLCSAFMSMPRRGQESSNSVEMDPFVKSAVLDSLIDNGRQLTNGVSSLRRNNVEAELSWACKLETHTYTILVWHVATTFCVMEREHGRPNNENEKKSDETKQNCKAATILSGYCAYLVAFVPSLLPDPTDAAEEIFDRAILDSRKLLKDCRTNADMYRKLKDDIGDGETIVHLGAKLGKQLISVLPDEKHIWKLLIDFWAEMMLFVTPSDNVMAHAENLANGGEFITHLWALLTHAGVLVRNSAPLPDEENPTSDSRYVQEEPIPGSQPIPENSNPAFCVTKSIGEVTQPTAGSLHSPSSYDDGFLLSSTSFDIP